jgi:hypothetical protein
MTKAVQLVNGNLTTADFLSAAAKRRDPCVRDIIRDGNGRITKISWFSNAARTQELYRKEITWTNGVATLAKHTDLVNNLTQCKAISRVGGGLQVSVELCVLRWGTLPIQWGTLEVIWT